MAPTSIQYADDIFRNRVQRTYSFDEAIELMKIADKYPQRIGTSIQWADAKTGKPVSIGYSNSQ